MLNTQDRNTLLTLARESISHGLKHGASLAVKPAKYYSEALQKDAASFVTLHCSEELRGCIGNLAAYQPLVSDVVANAYNAAFRDPRFTPLRHDELEKVHIHIEVLSPPQPLSFTSEEELLAMLRPGVDGLVLRDNSLRGTFLPSVWTSLPEPAVFLQQLKRKAGLPADYWSDSIVVERYTTEAFGEPGQ
ncbi:AmmeMemoRadiSam system protein A [Sulfuriflexus sp.]|uniref:AmmeMemoRadiSam system protein A n=1 Tax=Sulfuriflexus sp. TaxID=2015443 RepID=UPI0028CC2255|nr:AmmeMemoRadiSam system protein A [Sulfuriflexus sp.]MDT8404367.1 AmmeMemoRadiSam system protein A [Sulfuriflexus sp.]